MAKNLLFTGLALSAILPASGEAVKPYRGLAYTEEDILEVRRLAKVEKMASEIARRVLEKAGEWANRTDEEIIALIPKPDAVFAYGFAGDPKTGQPWPQFGGSDNVCSLDRPGEVRSPHTGDVYGIQKPGEEFYDNGSGWVRPGDGRRFYFKGIWNSYVVDQLHEGIDYLSLAYMLTGNPELARKALFIFDRLATLRKSPDYAGLIDKANEGFAESSGKSFFRYRGNLANQRTITSALALDLIGRAPYASAPSSDAPGVTVFDHIAANYFDLYEREHYLDRRGSLMNHGTILFANLIAQGVLFGKPETLRTGIEALYAFVDSAINRDGDYFELAGGYGRLGRDYGSRMVGLLVNYDPANYSNAPEMPNPKDYPYDLRMADDPRWYETVIGMLYRLPVLGRYPQYGDVNPDRTVLLHENNRFLEAHRSQYLRMFYEQTTREDWKREMEILYTALPAHAGEQWRVEDLLLYGVSQWKDLPPPPADSSRPAEAVSELMGGKNIAILRSGGGSKRRALFMRGGVNATHGHDDQMAIVPYGHGMVLAGVYGYRTSETPDHLSWGSRAISHLAATVNEDLPPSYLYKGFANQMNRGIHAPSASVTGYAGIPPAQFVEMSNPFIWSHASEVTDYRRTSWLVDVDADGYYFVDIFRIIGGHTHDYVWNAPYSGRAPDAFTVNGIRPEVVKDVWTLAALSGKQRRAAWNQPGQSWGERLDGMAAGRILPIPGVKDSGLSGQKHPPVAPGNGYGMIWDVKACDTEDDWEAVWKLQDNTHFLKARLINFDGMKVVTGRSPSLERARHFHIIVARRELEKGQNSPLLSRFVNVVEVGKPEDWRIGKIEQLPLGGKDSVGLKVHLADGKTDYVLSNREAASARGDDKVQFSGRNAFVRLEKDGSPSHFLMQESSMLTAGQWKMEIAEPVFEARIVEVDPKEGTLLVDRTLPGGDALKGAMMLIRGADDAEVPYTHDEYYSIEEVVPVESGQSLLRFVKQSLILASAQVETVDEGEGRITCRWPSEVAGSMEAKYLRGRAVTLADGKAPVAVVQNFIRKDLEMTSTKGIQQGQQLRILAAQPGDMVRIPATAALTREEGGHFRLRTTTDVHLSMPAPGGSKLMLLARNNDETEVAQADEEGLIKTTIFPNAGEVVFRLQKP